MLQNWLTVCRLQETWTTLSYSLLCFSCSWNNQVSNVCTNYIMSFNQIITILFICCWLVRFKKFDSLSCSATTVIFCVFLSRNVMQHSIRVLEEGESDFNQMTQCPSQSCIVNKQRPLLTVINIESFVVHEQQPPPSGDVHHYLPL